MATAAQFQSLFPQFAATDTADIERWFTQAALRFTLGRFGAQADMAVYLYAAHQLTLFPPDAASAAGQGQSRGAVTSEKVGDLARGYQAQDLSRVPASLLEFTNTSYGWQLIGIVMSRRHGRARVVRTGSSRVADTSDSGS